MKIKINSNTLKNLTYKKCFSSSNDRNPGICSSHEKEYLMTTFSSHSWARTGLRTTRTRLSTMEDLPPLLQGTLNFLTASGSKQKELSAANSRWKRPWEDSNGLIGPMSTPVARVQCIAFVSISSQSGRRDGRQRNQELGQTMLGSLWKRTVTW